MNKKNVLSKASKSLCLIILSLLISVAVALSGCTKEKMPGKTPLSKSTTTCDILEKLPSDIKKNSGVNYAGKVKFLGIEIKKMPRNQLKVSYYWQLLDELGPYNRVFVHFTDQSNKPLFQDDHDFCPNHSSEEIRGKFIEESDTVVVPASALGKEVSVKIGIYGLSVGRLKIAETGGMPTDEQQTRALVTKIKL